MEDIYKTKATASGGRVGQAKTEDGSLSVDLVKPKELGGEGDQSGTNPEQLFACGYSACFLGAMKFSADQQDVDLPDDTAVEAEVGIGKRDDGQGFGISANLTITVPGVDKETAQKIVDQAHVVCPYSHAIKDTIDVKLNIA